MLNIQSVNEFITNRDIALAGETIQLDDNTFYVFIKMHLDKEQKQRPSTYLLNKISHDLKEENVTVYFVQINDDIKDLDSSLKVCVFDNFSELVRNTYLSVEASKANVWIEPKVTLTNDQRFAIHDLVEDFLILFNFDKIEVFFTQSENIPTPTAILKTIRMHAPCELGDLSNYLSSKDFTIPNARWLNHSVDKLRRTGQVVRLGNGKYILSLKGLSALGTKKSTQSPDIMRSLALARKGD